MDISKPDSYQFGEWVIEPHLNRIRSAGGQEIHLELKAIEVLCYLLEHPGQTVTLDELLDNVWADRIVEPNAIHRNLSLIRRALGDDPHHPSYIETISKRGYRTIAPVRNLGQAAQANGKALPEEAAAAELNGSPRRVPALGAAALSILGVWALWWWSGTATPPPPQLPASQAQATAHTALPNSVAVLPFTNLSPDADDAFFAAGMHEEIINHLFKWSGLSVIGRTSVLGYTNTSKAVAEIAAELGVRTLMTGTVRYGENQVRIAAQLIDAQSALILWSETYDRELDEVFEIQQEIASSIARRLNATLQDDTSTEKPRNPQAYLLYLQARHLLGLGGPNADRVLRAEKLLNSALQLDPNDITVKMELARVYLQKAPVGLAPAEDTRELRRNLILEALAIDPDHAIANAWLGWHAMFSDHDWETAARQYERATALDPTNVNIMRGAVVVMLKFGRLHEAEVLAGYAVKHDPLCAICLANLVSVQLASHNFAAAVQTSRSVLALAPSNENNGLKLAIALLLNGQAQDALAVLEPLAESANRAVLMLLARYDLGDIPDSPAAIDALSSQWPERQLSIATAYAWTGNPDGAFEWLGKAAQDSYDNQQTGIFGGPFDPLLDSLKADYRWQSFLGQVGRAPDQLGRYDFSITLPE